MVGELGKVEHNGLKTQNVMDQDFNGCDKANHGETETHVFEIAIVGN